MARHFSSRRRCLQALAALTLGGLSGMSAPLALAADNYPNREITFIVPYPPGGNSDNLARVYADRLRVKLGVPIVVENRPGGTTSLGTGLVARAKPDGYTLLLATSTAFTVLPFLREVPYDPVKSFDFVGSLAGYLPIMTVRNDLPVSNLKEFVELARKEPGTLTFGSAGVASGGHLAGEILKNSESLDMLHVPFKGSADTMTALLGNHIDFFIDGVGLELVKSGKAKALVTYAGVRHPELPDVPTPKEEGFDLALPFEGFWGVAAPAGTPAPVMARLAKATEEILSEPQTQERFHRISVTASWKDGQDYEKDLDKSRDYYRDMLKTIKMSSN